MSDNIGMLQVPISAKSSETITNDAQKLVYVHIPKDKTQDLPVSHMKILPPKSTSGSTSTTNYIPLTGKIGALSQSTGLKESSLSTSFTVTKTTKLSGGSNLTFTPRPTANSMLNKARPPILGNKVTLSPAISSPLSIPINQSPKSLKFSLSGNRSSLSGSSSTSTIFKTTNSINSANVIVTQVSSHNVSANAITFVGLAPSTTSPLIYSPAPVQTPPIGSQASPKSPQSVILQSKILTGTKTTSPKVISQKILPHSRTLMAKQPLSNKTVSYGTLLSSGVNSGSPDSPVDKRERTNFGSFIPPPPLILQSSGKTKKLGNKKGGPTMISIVTGKSQGPGSGFSVNSLPRTNNVEKANMVNFKISNGQIQSTNSVRFDGIICDSRPMLMNTPTQSANPSSASPRREDDTSLVKDVSTPESTTFFKKVLPGPCRQSEQKDILQEAMSAMVSDMSEKQSQPSNSEASFSQFNAATSSAGYSLPNLQDSDSGFASSLEKKAPVPNKSQSLHEPIPILLSKPLPVGGSTSVLLQGPVPGATSLSVPVSVQGLIPVKMQSSPVPTTSAASSKAPDFQGLIIRTDSVTVRRKTGKEEERRESPKPDLSIIPILRNSSLENRPLPSLAKTQGLSLLGPEPFKDDFNKENSVSSNNFTVAKLQEVSEIEAIPITKQTNSLDSEKTEQFQEAEVKELLKWENGTGSLIGSDLKFTVNEFDAVELVEDKALHELKSQITSLPHSEISKPEDFSMTAELQLPSHLPASVDHQPSSSVTKTLSSTVHIHHARKPNLNKKDDESAESVTNPDIGSRAAKNPYDICCCKNCGCYGLSSEFFKSKDNSFCTIACSEDYAIKEAEWNKEKQRLEKNKNKLKKKASEKDVKEAIEKVEIKIQAEIKTEKEREPLSPTEPQIDNSLQLKEDKAPIPEVHKFQHPWEETKSNVFSWVKYLEHCGKSQNSSRSAPLKLWTEPFPFGKNLFKTGMKIEGIDPQHQSLFCVMTVVDVIGHRIRLHFDGYSDLYDFWCNANSPNIFPIGWCEKNGRKLETPPGIFNFSWKAYLEHCKSTPAPRQAFATRNCTTIAAPNSFRIGMKLEADDRKNGWTCVGTVADLLDNRILVHFDGWDKAFDTWFDITSPFIHPIGWCAKNGVYLYPPKDYGNPDSFNWHEYLQETNSMGVPARAFKTRPHKEFKLEMKLEAVDKRNSMLIRVATIAETKDYRVLLHFDGWPDIYDYWLDDDSPDIHPPTWCSKTGHLLQPPLTPQQCAEDVDSGVGCGTQGCKGFGHVKGLIYNTHHTAYGCPYSLQNLNKDWDSLSPDRLDPPVKEKRKTKGPTKPFINLDTSKPIPEDANEDSQKKRVRKRRKFFDELTPPECSKTKITRTSSDDFVNKSQVPPKLSHPVHSGQVNVIPSSSSSSLPVIPSTSTPASEGPSAYKKSSVEDVSVDTMVHQSIFNPGYHPNPPPPLPHTLERHKHIIAALKLVQRCEMDNWGSRDVRDVISKIPGCESSSEKFLDQDIDGESLLMLTQTDLVELLGLKLGPAIKIMSMIITLKNMP